MNNVTISDLSEKSTLEDTDLFLVRDSNDADMKIKGKVFADKITDSLSGYTKDNDTLSTLNTASKKPVNSSAVNSALTDYGKLNFVGSSYISNSLDNAKTVGNYRVGSDATSKPYSTSGYLSVIKRSDSLITQIFYGDNNLMAIRTFTTTWSSWEKVTTESQVNTTLTNLFANFTSSNSNLTIVRNQSMIVGKKLKINLFVNVTTQISQYSWALRLSNYQITTDSKGFIYFRNNSGSILKNCFYITNDSGLIIITTQSNLAIGQYEIIAELDLV